ncbi:oxidoreductase [Eremomyces bilateralis CBS 781.70]|uniref:Oxidoreductase n=1 Tax=Eremomyces bilateralis CBS 781.70 TaxID=1392243 RepID=A0A6G1GCR6_9PEZI|nr:oxidoreductase [Eremomyces bilateralis CBS 781.70]KAF1815649.1 oxidoreductase [Eremomyces bilateralis CBS 781.70]
MASTRSQPLLFQPLKIANGTIELKHRVILAPLTRNRGVPVFEDTPEKPNRDWYPDELVTEYYQQRATEGGLLISEGLPPSLQGGGMPGTTGLYLPEHIVGWKKVVEAVHAKGGYIYAQLWHSGRTTIAPTTGLPSVAPSAVKWDDPNEEYPYPPPGHDKRAKYRDHPPVELTVSDIKRVIGEYCEAARRAVEECGFDGVEVHGGNGYLPEQFLSSNVNMRNDDYGGSPEKRCRFVVELMEELAKTAGQEKVALRLSPFGLFNQARGSQRMGTWSHLCKELKTKIPHMSYVSFIEPRYEQVFSTAEKDSFLGSWGLETVDLSHFRKVFGDTPFFSAGGWYDGNFSGVLESGRYDALLFGRWFISNPDLVRRLREGLPLRMYERDRFYGPFPDRERGYTDYTAWDVEKEHSATVDGIKGDVATTSTVEVKASA